MGDWGTFYYGRSCPKWSVTEDATIPCIRYGELYTKFGAKIDKVYSYTNMSPESLRFSKGTEVLIPRVGEDPMDYNHCTWLSMPDVAIGEMISVFNTENNPLFTATMFNATLQNEFAMRVEGGSVTNLYFEKLKNIDVLFPSLEEQEKIATYFDSLDHLITLHQRKRYHFVKRESFAWEQRKLGEVVDVYDGVHQTPDYKENGVMFLSAENISTLQSNKYISEEAFERDYKVYPEKGDILMTRIGDIGTTNVVESTEKVAFYVSLALLKTKITNPYFLSNAMKNEAFQKGLRQRSLLTAIPQKINKDEIGKTDIFLTVNLEEQEKIGDYFRNLDHLITLHQRKCDETKKLKKYMLQKMFPQNGKKVPELRFSEFTDDWEQRKLGEVAKYRNGRAHENNISEGGKYVVINSKFVSTDGEVRKFSDTQIEPLYKGEIAFVLSDVPNGRAIARTFLVDKSEKYTLNQRIAGITPNENTDSYFLHILMNRNKYFLRFDDGNKQTNLSVNDVVQFEESYPSHKEQQKIGEYFAKLDHLITLHQRKYEELQKVKKFMLQNMFV